MGSSVDEQHLEPTVQPPWALVAPKAFSQSLFNLIPTRMGSNTSQCWSNTSWVVQAVSMGSFAMGTSITDDPKWPQLTKPFHHWNYTCQASILSPSSHTSDPAFRDSCKQILGAQATSKDPPVREAALNRMNQLHLSQLSFHSWKIRWRDLNVSKWKKKKKIPTYKILWKWLQIKSSIEAVKPLRAESTAPSLGRGSSAHLFGWWKQRDLKIALLR